MKKIFLLASLTLLTPAFLIGCNSQEIAEADTATKAQAQAPGSQQQGTLRLVAEGEDRARQGFVSRDGWQLNFAHIYVTLDDVTAYQADPPFDPEKSDQPQATEKVVLLNQPETIDLAQSGEDADAILVTTEKAPPGTYNALSWRVVEAKQGPAAGSTMVLVGTSQKEGQNIDFAINFNQPLEYTCGQYVGDERKGILKAAEEAELETTFHFDHIFGDASADGHADSALGFEPLAKLAQNGKLEVDSATLKQELSNEDYQRLQQAIAGLGHVGEGHCRVSGGVAYSQ